jgi:lysozyme
MTDFADLAHPYQKGADLGAYRAGGHDRVVLKATQGVDYVNPLYAQWAARCAALSLPFGAYHYATGDDAETQVAHFLSTLDAGHMPWWLIVDCEWKKPADTTPADGRHVADTLNRLANRGAEFGHIYGSPAWIAAAQLLPAMVPAGWRVLWLASYGTTQLKVPAGWAPEAVAAWQYTNAAPTAGVPNPCDRSRVMREWLTPSGGSDMELPDLDKVATAPGKNAPGESGFGNTVIGACVAAETAVNVSNAARADIATLKTILSGLLTADHPAQNVITDPVGDLITRISGLGLLDATRVLTALSNRMAQLIPTT